MWILKNDYSFRHTHDGNGNVLKPWCQKATQEMDANWPQSLTPSLHMCIFPSFHFIFSLNCNTSAQKIKRILLSPNPDETVNKSSFTKQLNLPAKLMTDFYQFLSIILSCNKHVHLSNTMKHFLGQWIDIFLPLPWKMKIFFSPPHCKAFM